jgi:hypothetical protein
MDKRKTKQNMYTQGKSYWWWRWVLEVIGIDIKA